MLLIRLARFQAGRRHCEHHFGRETQKNGVEPDLQWCFLKAHASLYSISENQKQGCSKVAFRNIPTHLGTRAEVGGGVGRRRAVASSRCWVLGCGLRMFPKSSQHLPRPRSQARDKMLSPAHITCWCLLTLRGWRFCFSKIMYLCPNVLETGCPVQVIAEGECPPYVGGQRRSKGRRRSQCEVRRSQVGQCIPEGILSGARGWPMCGLGKDHNRAVEIHGSSECGLRDPREFGCC